jgi:hypothetical protein
MNEDFEALEAMRCYGGSFASKLAEAWMRADAYNAAKLRAAFGDLLAEYRAMAERDHAKGSQS